jgi:hypothetical protein
MCCRARMAGVVTPRLPLHLIATEMWKVRVGPIVLQNDFERWSKEHFSEIARQCGILIQESAPSDSNLAHYWPIGSSSATFATQSANNGLMHCNIIGGARELIFGQDFRVTQAQRSRALLGERSFLYGRGYFVTIGGGGVVGGVPAAGEITNVTHAFQPEGRSYPSNSA